LHLQAARKARDEERERFLAEVADERRHIAEERAKAWAEVDAARAESMAARSKVADFEARATVAMKAAAAAREEAEVISGHLQAERDAIAECASDP
jgi:hypothetical protein